MSIQSSSILFTLNIIYFKYYLSLDGTLNLFLILIQLVSNLTFF